MCDGRFVANSADCGKLGADDLAADDDLAAIGNRARQKKFYHTRGCLFSRYSLIPRLPVLVKNIANGPMPLKLGVVAHGIILPDAPSIRIGGWADHDVMIVIFVKYIEWRKFCNICVWEGGRQPVRLTT